MVSVINSLESAADAYIAEADPEKRPFLFMATVEWMYASYEQDGYTEEQLDGMDVEHAASEYIERRRAR